MDIKTNQIGDLLRDQIKNIDNNVDVNEVGEVLEIGDGVARTSGLGNVMSSELVEFPNNVFGMALNLEEENVGVVLFGDSSLVKEGDIVNVDVTAFKDGWHGDTSRMFKIGKVSIKAEKLINSTYEAMMKAISIVKDNVHLGDIGSTIQKHVESEGFSVVQDFCGHGIGESFHKEPNILHYGEKGSGEKIKAGMIFTIEPMINLGKYETKTLNDGWTAVTKDKKLSAQFEHTVGVTNDGYEIFTLSKKGLNFPPYKK